MPDLTPRQALDQLLVRALSNPRTTLSGALSFLGGAAGLVSDVYFPHASGPKLLLFTSGLIGLITTTLAKDK